MESCLLGVFLMKLLKVQMPITSQALQWKWSWIFSAQKRESRGKKQNLFKFHRSIKLSNSHFLTVAKLEQKYQSWVFQMWKISQPKNIHTKIHYTGEHVDVGKISDLGKLGHNAYKILFGEMFHKFSKGPSFFFFLMRPGCGRSSSELT